MDKPAITKSNVNLYWNPRSGQNGVELHVNTLVLGFFLDPCALD